MYIQTQTLSLQKGLVWRKTETSRSSERGCKKEGLVDGWHHCLTIFSGILRVKCCGNWEKGARFFSFGSIPQKKNKKLVGQFCDICCLKLSKSQRVVKTGRHTLTICAKNMITIRGCYFAHRIYWLKKLLRQREESGRPCSALSKKGSFPSAMALHRKHLLQKRACSTRQTSCQLRGRTGITLYMYILVVLRVLRAWFLFLDEH